MADAIQPYEPPDQTKSGLVDLLTATGISSEKTGLRVTHFSVCLIFAAVCLAAGVSLVLGSPWPITAAVAALGFRPTIHAITFQEHIDSES